PGRGVRAPLRPLGDGPAGRGGVVAPRRVRPRHPALGAAEDVGASMTLVGIQPRFPGLLGRWKWLNEPVPAERVAALRIAAALALLLDLALGCLPQFADHFTDRGLAGSEAFPWRFREGHFYWSLLRWLPDSWGPEALMAAWASAAVALLVGYRPFVTGL